MSIKPEAFMTERHDLVTVVPGNPSAGDPLTWPIPANLVVQVVFVQFLLTTSGTAGDRLAVVFIQDASVVGAPYSPAFIEQTATLAWTYYFSTGIAPLDHTTNHNWVFQPLACCYQAKEGESLVVNVDGIDALDTITVIRIRYFAWKAD